MNDAVTDAMREQIVASLPRLRRFARTLTRHASDADDLVQIAVERALLRSDQWRPDASLLSWLFGIVRNAWIDEMRSRRRRSQLFVTEEAAEQVGESTTDRAVDLLAIQAALERLPDEQRMAVGLVLVEGLSYKEAAAVLEVPIGTLARRSTARSRNPSRRDWSPRRARRRSHRTADASPQRPGSRWPPAWCWACSSASACCSRQRHQGSSRKVSCREPCPNASPPSSIPATPSESASASRRAPASTAARSSYRPTWPWPVSPAARPKRG